MGEFKIFGITLVKISNDNNAADPLAYAREQSIASAKGTLPRQHVGLQHDELPTAHGPKSEVSTPKGGVGSPPQRNRHR